MGIVITSALAAVFFCLYILEAQDYKLLQKENNNIKDLLDSESVINSVDDQGDRLLDTESAMDAIRFNGFVPELSENWIVFKVSGGNYYIDPDRLPVLIMMRHYNLDKSEWDMDLMHKAAHAASDDIIIGKALFLGEKEDGVAFEIAAVGETHKHLKHNLSRYIEFIDETYDRMRGHYDDLFKKQKEQVAILPGIENAASGVKKLTS